MKSTEEIDIELSILRNNLRKLTSAIGIINQNKVTKIGVSCNQDNENNREALFFDENNNQLDYGYFKVTSNNTHTVTPEEINTIVDNYHLIDCRIVKLEMQKDRLENRKFKSKRSH